MKWFLVVVRLISNHPGGQKDMWVVAKYYESEQQCVISGGESNIGLLARAHKEFDYYKKHPRVQPWDAWRAYCISEEQFKKMMLPPKEETNI